ncbi:MAG: DNA adenine methylase [Elusimicrobiales bacterium]|nr:DNA adenine methylase [Elusimicrobiales bacterium]
MNINSRRYLGNKYKLLPFITATAKRHCPGIESVADIFAGTGSVAYNFIGKRLITNDILYSNYICHLAWFSPEQADFAKIESILQFYNAAEAKEDNYMSINFSGTYFSRSVCRKIGFIREHIEGIYARHEINSRERAILITSLLYAMDKIACTCGHYDAYRKNASLPETICFLITIWLKKEMGAQTQEFMTRT